MEDSLSRRVGWFQVGLGKVSGTTERSAAKFGNRFVLLLTYIRQYKVQAKYPQSLRHYKVAAKQFLVSQTASCPVTHLD